MERRSVPTPEETRGFRFTTGNIVGLVRPDHNKKKCEEEVVGSSKRSRIKKPLNFSSSSE